MIERMQRGLDYIFLIAERELLIYNFHQELDHVAGGQADLDKYLKTLAGKERKPVDFETGTQLKLDSTIRYEKDGNVQIVICDEPEA